MSMSRHEQNSEAMQHYQCITLRVAGSVFAIPIAHVEDVFANHLVTPVPLAPHAVVGLLNLRGKVVTALCLTERLNLSTQTPPPRKMVVGLGIDNETFGLLVDGVGDVLELSIDKREPVPPHFDTRWSHLASGVHQTSDGLLVELDISALLDIKPSTIAA
jgi:purine-binding chemotaxis protein CheW